MTVGPWFKERGMWSVNDIMNRIVTLERDLTVSDFQVRMLKKQIEEITQALKELDDE